MKYTIDFDSSERDPTEFPNPNDYTPVFGKKLYNVQSFKIVNIKIPQTQKLINYGNKTFSVDGIPVTLSERTYTTGTDLAAALQASLIAAATVVNVVSYSSATNRLTFSGTSDFTFEFYTGTNGLSTSSNVGTPAIVMGFTGKDETSVGSTLESGIIDLNGPSSIIVSISRGEDNFNKDIFISDGMFSIDSNIYNRSSTIKLPPLYTGRYTTTTMGSPLVISQSDEVVEYTFNRYIELDSIRIRFYWNNGNKLILYDSGGVNNFLKIEFECSLEKNIIGHTVDIERSKLPEPIDTSISVFKDRDKLLKYVALGAMLFILLSILTFKVKS
jgi:hypothetical protein